MQTRCYVDASVPDGPDNEGGIRWTSVDAGLLAATTTTR